MTEAQLYRAAYRLLDSLAHPRQKRVQFDDRLIVRVYLWSVLHERPVCWACKSSNRPASQDASELPSDTTMSRRLRSVGVQQLLERALAAAAEAAEAAGPAPLVKQMDSKPMFVGAYSKDPDAKRGHVGRGLQARGYRLHTLNHGRIVRFFAVAPMNEHDSLAAPRLLARLGDEQGGGDGGGGGYVLADNAYDTNQLHGIAASAGHQLVSPPRACNQGVRDLKYNTPQRIRALDLLDSPLKLDGLHGRFGQELYHRRQRIESCYGSLTLMGLHSLPAWVRGPRRVALWAGAKILLYLCREAKNKRLTT